MAQQVKISWMDKGEASAQFFKSFASILKMIVHEMRLRDDNILKSWEDIHLHVVDFFQEFHKARPMRELPNLSELVSNDVLEHENWMLLMLPSIQEVKEAMFSNPIDSSLGQNGFGSGFFQLCWDMVEVDVVEAVRDFSRGTSLQGSI